MKCGARIGFVVGCVLAGAIAPSGIRSEPAPPPARSRGDANAEIRRVVDSAYAQTRVTKSYDPAYARIAYPGGDVAMSTGVCADVVIRAFRAAGVDLQQTVHDDMQRNFSAYPQNWGLKRPDTNIDHRRVQNLMTYFKRAGKSLPITTQPTDYRPGDIVSWTVDHNLPHIGVVADNIDARTKQPVIVHNIGYGTKMEYVLFAWPITGHYRYFQ